MFGRPSENTLSAQGLKINNAKVNNLTVIEILIDPDVYSLILSCKILYINLIQRIEVKFVSCHNERG